jgi:hypothetical protein
MRVLRPLSELTSLDSKRNITIVKKLQVNYIVEDILQCKRKWQKHVARVERGRLTPLAFQCRQIGLRNLGRPKHRWNDRDHVQDQEERFVMNLRCS